MSGSPATSTKGLGKLPSTPDKREPSPAAKMTICSGVDTRELYSMSGQPPAKLGILVKSTVVPTAGSGITF